MKRDFYICELAWTPHPEPCSEIMLRCSDPSHQFAAPHPPRGAFAPKRADLGVVKTPEKKHGQAER